MTPAPKTRLRRVAAAAANKLKSALRTAYAAGKDIGLGLATAAKAALSTAWGVATRTSAAIYAFGAAALTRVGERCAWVSRSLFGATKRGPSAPRKRAERKKAKRAAIVAEAVKVAAEAAATIVANEAAAPKTKAQG